MICIRSSTGRSDRADGGQTAQAMPSGMPTMVERMIATAISARVVIALGHISEIPFGPPFGICRTPNEAIIERREERGAPRADEPGDERGDGEHADPRQPVQEVDDVVRRAVQEIAEAADDVVQEEVRAVVVRHPVV